MKKILALIVMTTLIVSCVSKKKYVELEGDLTETRGELQKTTIEKEELEAKMAKIEIPAHGIQTIVMSEE